MSKKIIKKLQEKLEKSDSDLEKYVIENLMEYNKDDQELKIYLEDLQSNGCISGMVGSLIYYYDTNKFYDKFENEIEDLLDEYKEMCGYKSRPEVIMNLNGSAENIEQEKNLLAWFAYEDIAYKIYNEYFEN